MRFRDSNHKYHLSPLGQQAMDRISHLSESEKIERELRFNNSLEKLAGRLASAACLVELGVGAYLISKGVAGYGEAAVNCASVSGLVRLGLYINHTENGPAQSSTETLVSDTSPYTPRLEQPALEV